jgi:phenylacetate-CoA ligase
VEVEDGVVLVTNTHPGCINPVLRYRIGDRGELVRCPCGRGEPALRLLGRDDPQLKFVSILVTPEEIAGEARAEPGVRDVQLAVFGLGRADERMEVRILLEPDADRDDAERRVRQRVLTRVYRLGWAVASAPSSFAVRAVDRLEVNRRTHKTPLLVHNLHA